MTAEEVTDLLEWLTDGIDDRIPEGFRASASSVGTGRLVEIDLYIEGPES